LARQQLIGFQLFWLFVFVEMLPQIYTTSETQYCCHQALYQPAILPTYQPAILPAINQTLPGNL